VYAAEARFQIFGVYHKRFDFLTPLQSKTSLSIQTKHENSFHAICIVTAARGSDGDSHGLTCVCDSRRFAQEFNIHYLVYTICTSDIRPNVRIICDNGVWVRGVYFK